MTTLQAGEAESRRSNRAAIGGVDFANGSYRMVQAATPASYAVQIDLRGMVPWDEWPMKPETSPVRVTLEYRGQRYVVQPGNDAEGLWHFDFRKRLAADSQPFDVVAARSAGWADLPWLTMLAWTLFVAATLAGLLALVRQRAERRRAEELLRLGQVARLNTLGELAAGMAHELNQPLTAILANTQAASRLLDEEPPELATARDAMARTVEQARRASDVVGRLRRVVERPDVGEPAAGRQPAGRRAQRALPARAGMQTPRRTTRRVRRCRHRAGRSGGAGTDHPQPADQCAAGAGAGAAARTRADHRACSPTATTAC